jgi:hypothetical protein
MNAFYEHYKNSIRFGYRCFDRILLNGLIQPFQQPERVVGFFSQYRNQYPVSRDVLREIAESISQLVKNRPEKWSAPCSMLLKVVGAEGGRARHPFRRGRQVSVRGAGRTVLEAGVPDVV